MARIRLGLAFSRNNFTAPLMDGEIEPEGVELVPSIVPAGDLFWRQLRYGEFDASEMSLSELCIHTSQGKDDWLGIPVFPSRGFFHTRIFVSIHSGIQTPQHLRGKRVGVPDYVQTGALWTRGVLQHYYGVAPDEMKWFVGRRPERSHATLANVALPSGLDITHVADGDDLGTMVREGRLDAVIAYGGAGRISLGMGMDPPKTLALGLGSSTFVDPVRRDLDNDALVRPLFSDPLDAARQYFRDTGLLQINHVLVIKRSVTLAYPWLARNLYDAFVLARDLAISRLTRSLEPFAAVGAVDLDAVAEATASFGYGISANRDVLEAATRYSREQQLIQTDVRPEQMFAETTRHL